MSEDDPIRRAAVKLAEIILGRSRREFVIAHIVQSFREQRAEAEAAHDETARGFNAYQRGAEMREDSLRAQCAMIAAERNKWLQRAEAAEAQLAKVEAELAAEREMSLHDPAERAAARYAAEASDLTVRLMAAEARVGELESDGSRLICWNHDGIVYLDYVKETKAGPMYTCPQCSASVVRQESPDGE